MRNKLETRIPDILCGRRVGDSYMGHVISVAIVEVKVDIRVNGGCYGWNLHPKPCLLITIIPLLDLYIALSCAVGFRDGNLKAVSPHLIEDKGDVIGIDSGCGAEVE